LSDVTDALAKNNLVGPSGMYQELYTLYLMVVDGRVHNADDIANLVVAVKEGHPVQIRDFARVQRAPEPVFNVVTAEGVNAVLMNIRSQPDGSTLDIAAELKSILAELRKDLPPDVKLAYYYDQSLLVRACVRSVWECISSVCFFPS
jgi:multidrug efflux pump subunit AcrB